MYFIDSEAFRKIFRRGKSYDSMVFPFSTLLFYLLSNIIGIAYVNISNLNFYRGDPFLNKRASYSALLWTILLSPIFFIASGMIMLRSKDSVSSLECVEGAISC